MLERYTLSDESEIAMRVRTRFWLEAAFASLCGLLAVLTLFWRDWIEALTGFGPDGHNGSFEWLIVAVLLVLCVVIGMGARADRQVSLRQQPAR